MPCKNIFSKDLVVTGAGLAGICAAIAAARHGLEVALIHNRPIPGGNASSEVGVRINGAACGGNGVSVYARETGIVEEIKMKTLELYQCVVPYNHYNNWAMLDAAFLEILYQEKNIDLFLNTSVYDVMVENGKVIGLFAHEINSEREFLFKAPFFVDASGDGTVAYKAGARFMRGEEGRNEFGESLAPEKSSKHTMGNTILLFSRDAGEKVKYKKPDFAYDITSQPFWKNIKPEFDRAINQTAGMFRGYWWIEIGGLRDVVSESEYITRELRKIVYGLWDYIKNSGQFDNVDTLLLDKVSIIAGKRESRRFIGDYILTQNDIDDKTHFFDAIGHGGWTMDSHAPNGIYEHNHATYWHFVPGMYPIPFRTLYSKDIENLFITGRIHSASHLAMSSTRLMATCGVGGQAAGTAAWLCYKYGIQPRSITEKHIEELQEILIQDDQSIIGMTDTRGVNIFKDAEIEVSSTLDYENHLDPRPLPLEKDYCLALPCRRKIESVDILIMNSESQALPLRVEIYGGKRPENYLPEELIKTLTIEISPGFDGFVPLPVNAEHLGDKKLYILLRSSPGLSLYCNNHHYTGIVSFTVKENRLREKYPRSGIVTLKRIEKHICFKNINPAFNLYDPKNLVNGFTRPYGLPNLWISACVPGKEQFIQIKFPVPRRVNTFSVIFDTALEEDNLTRMYPRFIKKYTIRVYSAGNCIKEEIRDNCCGRRFTHRPDMEDVQRIELILQETYGASYFSVYGFRAE